MCQLYAVDSLVGAGMGHCCSCIIWLVLWATVDFSWDRSVFRHCYNRSCYPLSSYVPRMVPCPARSRSVVWEPSSRLCCIRCGVECCVETDGGWRSTDSIPVWQTTQATPSSKSVCLVHCAASCGPCWPAVSDHVLLGHHRVLGLFAILSTTHWRQTRGHGWQLLVCHVSSFHHLFCS